MSRETKRSRRPAPESGSEFPFGEPVEPIEYGAVEQIDLELLKVAPGNPRVHDEEQIHTLARMIQATRTMQPLMIDEDDHILTGEARLQAGKLLGMKTLPCVRAVDRSEAERQLFCLADNRAVELGRWDERLLAVSIKGLVDLKPNFNLEVTGWKHAEIEIKLASLTMAPEPDDAADTIPALPSVPVSILGDLWVCGKHRVLAGSALEDGDFLRLMDGQLARLILQDPPYNVSVRKHVGGLGKTVHEEFKMATGELSRDEFLKFLTDQLALNAHHCVPGGILMSFMDWRSIDLLIAAGRANDLELINICVWVKTNGSMGSLYRSKHELICIFRKSGGKSVNNVQLGKFGRYRTNVWIAPGANTFSKTRDEELGSHPTPKNCDTIADAIRDVTNISDIVVDSFLGSGTTLIAAERTGRIAYGIEFYPKYVDVAISRWEKFTGQQATLEGDGRTFSEIAAVRSSHD